MCAYAECTQPPQAQILTALVSTSCAQFLSVPQKGPTGEARSELDAALFTRALRNMMVWYSHPKILTLKLTALPHGYPDGFTFPPGITPNTASYFERGW